MKSKMKVTRALEVKNLNKTYSGGVTALKDVSFYVEEGEFFALLGPNGAGKTTTIGIVSSLVNKTSGTVGVFGYCLDKEPMNVRNSIGLVPQEFNFSIFEGVRDIVMNQAGYYGISRSIASKNTEYLLKKLDLWGKRNKQSKTLSGGMKRKLMIARALVHKPKLLILDEPTAGVDVETRREMWDFLRELNESGTTIILTTHYLEEAEQMCRRVVIINHGVVIENRRMKSLLSGLHTENFIADIEKPFKGMIPGVKVIDENTVSFNVTKENDLNSIFALLSKNHVKVLSLRNESNRLEKLFVDLVKK